MTISIPKKSSDFDKERQTPLTKTREERNQELALQQAYLLQEQKEFEALLLSSTEALLDFPTSSSDPASPSFADAAQAKSLLQPFRPSDYDLLIEERNIDKKCGYVLCSRPHRVEATKARFRILKTIGEVYKDIKVVERKELEKWCSDECGARALFIRVQLSEVPAWEKITITGEIELHGEKANRSLYMGKDEEVSALAEKLKQLAVERRGNNSIGNPIHLMNVDVQEKSALPFRMKPDCSQVANPPGSEANSDRIHDSIEGHILNTGGSWAGRKNWPP